MHTITSCKYVGISDLHLGSLSASAPAVLEFLHDLGKGVLRLCGNEIRLDKDFKLGLGGDIVDALLLNGCDLSELREQYPQHSDVIDKFNELHSQGVNISFTQGNHDCVLQGDEIPIKVTEKKLETSFVTGDGRRFLVTHGHIFDGWLGNRLFGVVGARAYEKLDKLSVQIDKFCDRPNMRLAFHRFGRPEYKPNLSQFLLETYHNGPYKCFFERAAVAYIDANNKVIVERNNSGSWPEQKLFDGGIFGHSHMPFYKRVLSPSRIKGQRKYLSIIDTGSGPARREIQEEMHPADIQAIRQLSSATRAN